MTTPIFSHVKDKNDMFTVRGEDMIFLIKGEILVFHQYLYNKRTSCIHGYKTFAQTFESVCVGL